MDTGVTEPTPSGARALWVSTIAFAACFAVWTLFSILGLGVKAEFGLTETQFALLVATPVLTGALSRAVLGILSDRFGGRRMFLIVMLIAAVATFLMSFADSYLRLLLAALGVGLAGGSFAVGISYVSKFVPSDRQGTAFGVFSVGTAGAVITEFLAPVAMLEAGWRVAAQLWAAGLIVVALVFIFAARDEPGRGREAVMPTLAEQLRPLRNLQVWRFSLYYFVLFGAFVGLSLWLPRYFVGVYGLDVKLAGLLTAGYAIPASLFRIYGGRLSDRYGARAVLYWTFGASALLAFMLSYPPTDYVIHGVRGPIAFSTSMSLAPFVVTLLALGFFMSLGMAAVLKHIPTYYPENVGSVAGVVSMVGGLGGFVLPLVFGVLNDLTGVWTSCFFLLLLLSLTALVWMHFAIRRMELQPGVDRGELPELPEMASVHAARVAREAGAGALGKTIQRGPIADWRPEDPAFWETAGRPIARRNLWISTYCLLLAFAVWMVWSVVVAKLPAVGFNFTPDELFWLAALPGLSGATLRIFYSFVVPLFGGRLWTAISTASLLVPAFGIGYAVQAPDTPYLIFVVLALLCGLGGGNFASSMANISFFFPKAEKGAALAINAGLGNLGVSLMQFVVPLAVTIAIFGVLGGGPQSMSDGGQLWMQNAGFLWVPFILLGVALAWFGMDDLAGAKASFADQAAVFERLHTWLMCWLYLGTFGSFIGFSAGFPLLARLAFPEVDSLKYVFLGPLIGALSRAGTGWLADRFGGARISLLVFVAMTASAGGMIWFLDAGSFWGFFATVMLLFFFSGVGNASTFQMIPAIWRETVGRAGDAARADREAAAVIGFTSAIAAFGAFFIPKAYGASIAATGSANLALWGFMLFYLSCTGLTFAVYVRRGGLLYAVERQSAARAR
ncbi:NNP family nitrate/nitrite transporter-like MFS transporter [Phenylobacterium koreense]|uniref:NNP family nitrate/nitrite transporter-like MFS transporter n=1 Tax=Phenylobacterium koreense TaxID=266125 RepID=A0ABV2ENM1_9CAUL